ncbi:metallophosphoesterase [Hyalangium rubrum]|uniref:Metallophosphoesterase n=1 Tax=Hyalangium rubrum TaxID=3103134 RepID=A0ABU5HBX7_9BACT|nr:metallophosphoesterase [Hyalangium sp. s54d21]MDY7230604.1 metallophosphoesterase [Hyalangium sp. s54d21]
MSVLRWLHLSDFHQGMPGHGWLWPNVREPFFKDLERLHARCGPWDLVLFTGDLTQRGSAEEFAQFEQTMLGLFEHLRKLGSHPKFLAVPGNHDLSRPDPMEPEVMVLRRWREEPRLREKFWTDGAGVRYRDMLRGAFAHYEKWWRETQLPRPEILEHGPLPGDFSATLELEKGGVRLGVLGLNTAFLQLTGDDYHRKLAVELPQFQLSCGRDGPAWASSHDACLLLSHHPPDWLDDEARRVLREEIAPPKRFVAHLFGHMHEGQMRTLSEGGSEPWRDLQAPSLFGLEKWGTAEETRQYGYVAGRLEFAEDHGLLRLWPRTAVRGAPRIVPNHAAFDLDDDMGTSPVRVALHTQRKKSSPSNPGLSTQESRPYELQGGAQAGTQTEDFVREYRTRLQSSFGRWDLAGIRTVLSGEAGPTTASLDSMYLPLRLGDGFDPDTLDAGAALGLDALLERNRPLVICGPAGSGKTTWMRWTFRQLARHEDSLPFMVELRRVAHLWSKAHTRGEDRTLDAYLRDWVAEYGVAGWGKALPTLLDSQTGPRPVLLVDGWDELGELGERLREQLMGFLAAHPRVLAVVTSRPYGESRPSRSEGFELLHIQPLSDGEIAQIANGFFRQVYSEGEQVAAASRERFLKALAGSPEATSLARTTLLLTMMLLISRHRPLPDKRHRLYEECIRNLLAALPDRREQEGALLSREQWRPEDSEVRLRVVAELAFQMQSEGYQECRTQVVRTWEELERFLPAEWGRERKWGFLTWLVASAGVMIDRTDGTLAFAHLSFQEYLAAHHLSTTRQSEEERKTLCREHMARPEWWETLRLWAALLDDRNSRSLEPVLKDLLHGNATGYWLAGAILADGPGEGVFETWVEGLAGRFHANEQSWAELSARAWASSRQDERRAALVSRWPKLAPCWSWLSVFLARHWSNLARLDVPSEWRNTLYPLIREAGRKQGVGLGRVLSGAVPVWPGMPIELVLLQLWPSPRVQAGSRLQTLVSLGASRQELLAAARHILAQPTESPELAWHWAQLLSAELLKELSTQHDFLAWDWARDWARHLTRFWGQYGARDTMRHRDLPQGLVPHLEREQLQDWTRDWKWRWALDWVWEWGETWGQSWSREWVRQWAQTLARCWSLSHDVPWLEDFVLAELQSSQGRSGTRAVLAYTDDANEPKLALFQEACRASLNPRRSATGLSETLTRWEAARGAPLWPALARHLARLSTPQDRALLELLARHPEGQGRTVFWGLKYYVRGDLVLADGGELTLNALCDELGLPHLPYLEDMPDELVSSGMEPSVDQASSRR